MWRREVRIIGFIFVLHLGTPVVAQGPAATQPQHGPEQEKQLDIAQAEREVSSLPRVRVQSIRQLVQFSVDADLLAARTTLSPVDGEVRVITPDLPGIVRLRVLDLPAVEDPSTGRNFTFIHDDMTQPGTVRAITHVASIAGRLMFARDTQGDNTRSSVQLIQDPPGTAVRPDEQPVRLSIRVTDEAVGAPQVDLTLAAQSFTDLRRKYPRELETYLRPLLRDFSQDQSIFAVDPRVAWQVLGEHYQPDRHVLAQVNSSLVNLDADDFREREAAMNQLRQIGQPAALVLQHMTRSNFSAEQNSGVDAFLAEYLQLKAADISRLRSSAEFLLDTLACEDAALRRLALEQLKLVLDEPVEFDLDGAAEARATQLRKLRESISPSPPSAPVRSRPEPLPATR